MPRIHIDIETYSEADLKKEGGYRYAQDASTDLNVVCWAVGSGPVNVWMPWKKVPDQIWKELTEYLSSLSPSTMPGMLLQGEQIPASLERDLSNPENQIAAHNAQFERNSFNGAPGEKHGCPNIAIERTVCTMAKCSVHGLPQALEHAANALGTHPKRKDGVNEMRYFAKPRKNGTRPTPYDEPARFIALTKYCIDDVEAERDIDHTVPDLTEREEQIYFLDQRINDRGVRVDRENVINAQALVKQYKMKLAAICRKVTGCNPTQTAKLAEWVRDNGYKQLENLQAATVVEALTDDRCPDKVKRVLKVYSTHNMKAVSKFDSMLRATGDDGQLRGMLNYYGAGPGRWSSRLVALQNMMRPLIKNADDVIEAMWLQDIDTIKEMHPDIDFMKVLASCVRGMLTARPGKKLMAYDFAQIESRIQAWLSDAEWKLNFFRSDTKLKVYHMTGSMMFGCKPEEVVDVGEDQRYTSAKIGELACGYQGWEKAVSKMARDNGMKLEMDPADIAGRWRDANPEQVQLWYEIEDACRYAMRYPGKAFALRNKKIAFKVVGRWLYMRLPSGRRIAYLDPQLIDDERPTYMGVNTFTRKWERVDTYGGKLLQNACEGIGRDLLANGLLCMEEAGYETVLTVHDEGVFEVDEDFGSDEEATRLMTIPLQWADGLPVKCDGWTARRYRK